MSRKLSISNIAWDPRDDAPVAELLGAEGFGGVEIAPTVVWPDPLAVSKADVLAYRAWWESRGIAIVALQSLLYRRDDLELFGSEQTRHVLAAHLVKLVGLAARLGARALVFGSPGNRRRRGLPLEDALAIATTFFRDVGPSAAASGAAFCIEPNPPAYGCDFITTTAAAAALCQSVDSAGVRVQGDLGAITLTGDSPATAIAMAGPLLAHFHASEPSLAEPGSVGVEAHEQAARALNDCGYAGWVSIEMRGVGERTERLDRVRRAMRFIKSVYG